MQKTKKILISMSVLFGLGAITTMAALNMPDLSKYTDMHHFTKLFLGDAESISAGATIQVNTAKSQVDVPRGVVIGNQDSDHYSRGDFASILGGSGNQIANGADYSVIGGGYGNHIEKSNSVIGGGKNNAIQTNGIFSFVGGGLANRVKSQFSIILGGANGRINVGGNFSILNSLDSTSLLNRNVEVSAPYNLAIGQNIDNNQANTFIWSDFTGKYLIAEDQGSIVYTCPYGGSPTRNIDAPCGYATPDSYIGDCDPYNFDEETGTCDGPNPPSGLYAVCPANTTVDLNDVTQCVRDYETTTSSGDPIAPTPFGATKTNTALFRSLNGLSINTTQTLPGVNANIGGSIQIARENTDCTSSNAGTIEYDQTDKAFMYCNGITWSNILCSQTCVWRVNDNPDDDQYMSVGESIYVTGDLSVSRIDCISGASTPEWRDNNGLQVNNDDLKAFCREIDIECSMIGARRGSFRGSASCGSTTIPTIPQNCSAYTLSVCPANAACSTCSNGLYKIDSCHPNYTQNGNLCDPNIQLTSCGTAPTGGAWVSGYDKFTQTRNGSAWTPASAPAASTNGATCRFQCNSGYTANGATCTANSCSALTNTGGYNVPALNHGYNSTQTRTGNGTVTNGSYTYSCAKTFTCNLGNRNTNSETCNYDYTCVTNYTRNGSQCVANSQGASCQGSIPANATSNASATTWSATRNGTSRSPSYSRGYNTTPGYCTFSCNTNYTRNGTSCMADSRAQSCIGLPANAVWNSVSMITQMRDGSSWMPTLQGAYSELASASYCRFKCDTNYTWNGSSCEMASSRYPGCDTDDITIGSYTVAACNIGAITAGTTSSSYGKFFMWGNNYAISIADTRPTTTCVNASGYGPGNYYNASPTTCSTNNWSRDSSNNKNLWGGSGDTITTNGAGTANNRKGPCATGYHIPSAREWNLVQSSLGSTMASILKLPAAGNKGNGSIGHHDIGYYEYWTSSPSTTIARAFGTRTTSTSSITAGDGMYAVHAKQIRCFKNSL